jgi:Tol biopolymer transport system component
MSIAACVVAAAVGAAIFFGIHLRGGINGRSAPSQGESSGLVALTRVGGAGAKDHIVLVDPSGRSSPRDLGPGWGPSWSPDGRRLVFTYEVGSDSMYGGGVGAVLGRGLGGGLERLFVMNADGGERHLLAMPWLRSARFEDSAPAWSPDGSRIAFTRTIWPVGTAHTQWTPGRSALYVLDFAHGGPQRVSIPLDDQSGPVTWSPDGKLLAYTSPASRSPCPVLHVTNADGTGDHVLAAAGRSLGSPGGCVPILTPAWSPDGHWIAFARLRPMKSASAFIVGRGPEVLEGHLDLYLISPDGKRLHRLTHQPNLIGVAPTWSPDGKPVAFESGRVGDPDPLQALVDVIDRDGSHRHTILHGRGHMYGAAAWQPRQ